MQRRLLDLPPTLHAAGVRALLAAVAHTPWHVRIEPPDADGRGLVVYLARYLRGGPLKNHRLVNFTGTTGASATATAAAASIRSGAR